MSDDYCFRRAAQGQLSQCNRRNTATVLRAVVKSHNGLKGNKVFACGCSRRNLKNLSKFAGKSLCWAPFIVTLQPVIAQKRLLGQLYQKRDAYTESPSKALPVNFENNYEHGDLHLYGTATEIMSNKELVTIEFSYVFVRNGSIHDQGLAKRLNIFCIII